MRRRARELALQAEITYLEEMRRELEAGSLAPGVIEFWEPKPGARIKTVLDGVYHQLNIARGMAAIVFP